MAAELEYYKEHLAHGRHIEVQRSTVAGLAVTISGAIIGELLKNQPLNRSQLPYTVTLLFVGLVAWLLSAKLYERFKLHNAIAAGARNILDPALVLVQIRKDAERDHKKDFPFLYPLPLHLVWYFLFFVISSVGAVTTYMALCGGVASQVGT
jgi:hypothetical protein